MNGFAQVLLDSYGDKLDADGKDWLEEILSNAKKMGARNPVLWSDAAALKALANQFDLLISTVPKAYPMQQFVNLLKLDATLVNVGAMEALQQVHGIDLIHGRKSIAGSMIGGIAETQQVIDFCAARNIKADIELVRGVIISGRVIDKATGKDIYVAFVAVPALRYSCVSDWKLTGLCL